MSVFYDNTQEFKRFAQEVVGAATADEGITALETFITECGLPAKMQELKSTTEITPELLRKVADSCNIIKSNPRNLTHDEIYDILMECM